MADVVNITQTTLSSQDLFQVLNLGWFDLGNQINF